MSTQHGLEKLLALWEKKGVFTDSVCKDLRYYLHNGMRDPVIGEACWYWPRNTSPSATEPIPGTQAQWRCRGAGRGVSGWSRIQCASQVATPKCDMRTLLAHRRPRSGRGGCRDGRQRGAARSYLSSASNNSALRSRLAVVTSGNPQARR